MKIKKKRFFPASSGKDGQDGVYSFESFDDANEYFKFRSDNDEFKICYQNEMVAVGIEDSPLLYKEECTDIQVPRNGYTIPLGDIDYEDADNRACIEDGPGIFLGIPYGNQMTPIPLGWSAISSLYQRACEAGQTMQAFEPKKNRKVLNVRNKARRLCEDFQLTGLPCKILIRDGFVARAVLSGGKVWDPEQGKDVWTGYVVLDPYDIFSAFVEEVGRDHPGFAFSSGTVSETCAIVEFLFNDAPQEDSMRQRLNDDAGTDISEIKFGCLFSNGETGDHAAAVRLFMIMDGVKVMLPRAVSMEHKGDASVEKFRNKCSTVGTILREEEDRIEEMGNTDINDVPGCVKKITDHFRVFHKNASEDVIKDLSLKCPNGGTAVDVFIALNDIIQRQFASKDAAVPEQYIQDCETVSEMMFLPFRAIDRSKNYWGD